LVATRGPSRRQRGVALLIALIMLTAMMMAGIAMFRKLGSGAILAGNMAFTSAAIGSAEQGSEAARTRLMTSSTGILQNSAAGYFPASCYTSAGNDAGPTNCAAAGAASFDPTTFDWDGASTLVAADDGAGNEVRYVIHRLCSMAGSLNRVVGGVSQQCSYSSTVTTTMHTDVVEITASIAPLYRITTRVSGPRNTVAYTQVTLF
jgi:type IV pilus assembly protein PilX